MIFRVYGHLAEEVQKKEALSIPKLYGRRAKKNETTGTVSNTRATKTLDSNKKGLQKTL